MIRQPHTTPVSENMEKKRLSFLFFVLLTFLLASCGKDSFLDFAKSTGETVTITRPNGEGFTKINLNDDVNLIISQGSSYSIKLEGGTNVLPAVETSVTDNTLTIKNNNTDRNIKT